MASRYGLEIRAANGSDAAGLAELLRGSGHPAASETLAERIEALRHGSGAALVAVDWGPPSGLVVLHWYPSLTASLPTAQITTLLVDPEARRRGIGRLLLKAASQAARSAGCGEIQLLARPDQAHLQAFGAATGFSDHGSVSVRPLRKKG
ncbi:GNAT family N-acetyltransferase [Methylobacterium sp. Leaf89]|uniref:GNAT family N-acetyltransferase n=1 Tax=Methylobacterium sp. Leaf89 TaxID=1736245 RepID=UPI0006F69DBE|nr:GNAT family N-acetyltransferase [Methylobacterium sp. Leaf89]KQO66437.1 GCN5 family acetyltransferase [Methylobacterium sp. Leaf89]